MATLDRRVLTLLIVAAVATACTTSSGGSGGGGVPFDTSSGTDTAAADTGGGAASDGATPSDTAVDSATGGDAAAEDTAIAEVDTGPTIDPALCADDKLSKLFHTKVKPLVSSGQPSTCNQCHFSGVDLGMFVQDTPCESMACMVEKGMVDFKDPAKSEVLSWIAKAAPVSSFITPAIQKAEHDVFLEWITHSATCHASTCGEIKDPCGGENLPDPKLDKPMIGGCDEATLAASFETKVYAYRERCAHCHAPYGVDNAKTGAPPFLGKDPGKGGSIITMYNVIGAGYIDVAAPDKSLLLLKPLAPKSGGVQHGGGVKFANKNDVSYKAFLQWIQQFAACKAVP